MYFCYMDESGDAGWPPASQTRAFVLGGVLVHEDIWRDALDDLVRFRRFLRKEFGLQVDAELKSNFLVHNGGPFKGLSVGDEMRKKIYKMALRLPEKMAGGNKVKVFAIVCDKARLQQHAWHEEPAEAVWCRAIERLERFTKNADDTCMLIPDEGDERLIRKVTRRMRRFSQVPSRFNTENLSRPAVRLIEDPSFRRSHESYFLQLADLVAFAAFRAIYPTRFVDASYWEALGTARLAEVNKYSGGPPGIKQWPPLPK